MDEGGSSERLLGLSLGALLGLLVVVLGLPGILWHATHTWILAPIFAGGGAFVWKYPKGRGALTVGTGLAAALGLLVVLTPLSRWLAHGLIRRDPPRSADLVFVFSSRIQNDGELTSVSMARLVHGLELLGEGLAPRICLSEIEGPGKSYTAPARALMDNLGLHQEVVTIGPVWNTHDEALGFARVCHTRGWHRVLAVTSPYHSRRACAALEAQGLEVVSSPCSETLYDLENLERVDDRLLAFQAALHERLGLWAYSQRGWIRPISR